MLTIVMYHYVRDGARVHARSVADFEQELDHVANRYECLSLADVVRTGFREDTCMLSFDDGLVEHLHTVAPALERRGLTGVFGPIGRAVVERRVVDVQKTQFLLAEAPDHAALGRRILDAVPDPERLWSENTPSHRFDPPETVFVKRALQDGVREELRRELLDELFAEHVAGDEAAFADGLYLTLADCRELVSRGHEVIGHGWEHHRLGLLSSERQREELERTRAFVAEVGGTWAHCYAYGSRNETTVGLLRELGCSAGLTTDPRRVLRGDSLFELPRIDTNDLRLEVAQRP